MAHDPERIRRIVESGSRNSHICPLCGFNRYTGARHPYGGNRAGTHNQTKWCTGKSVIQPVEESKKFPWGCPTCGSIHFYTHQEMEVCEQLGGCQDCLTKEGEKEKGNENL